MRHVSFFGALLLLGTGLVGTACATGDRIASSDLESNASPTDSDTPAPPPPTSYTNDGGGSSSGSSGATSSGGGDAGNDAGACKLSPPNNVCGHVDQCGCTLAETCDVVDATGNVGCIAAGTAPMGHACTSTAGCQRGLTCMFGTCHAFCDNAGSACGKPNTGKCYQVKTQAGQPAPNYQVCMVQCDVRDANACGGTTAAGSAACLPDGEGGTDCETAGTRAAGQSCDSANRCGAGTVCVVTNGQPSGTCKKWCRVGVNADCGGATCAGFQTKEIIRGVEHGHCP
jgi:hypothetical protein